MFSKTSCHILKSYQNFMRYKGILECLHCDLAPEQKSDKMTKINQNMMVKDSFSKAGHLNQNPAESLGVRVVKSGTEALMNHTGTPAQYWPWAHKYNADVNNHCATPFLNWEVPITKRHGYTPDISPFLQYQFYEKIYYKTEEKAPNAKEQAGYWLGVNHTVGDLLTYDIFTDDTENIIQRSVI